MQDYKTMLGILSVAKLYLSHMEDGNLTMCQEVSD